MRFLFLTLFYLIALPGHLSAAGEKQESTPNPANAEFPAYWDAKSWDTPKGATFWNASVPRKAKTATSDPPISQTPQPNDFLDRQSEK